MTTFRMCFLGEVELQGLPTSSMVCSAPGDATACWPAPCAALQLCSALQLAFDEAAEEEWCWCRHCV